MRTVKTLQNFCIDEIVSRFGIYYQAYYVSEDPCLKLKLEFLKKRYSVDIVQKLIDEYCLKKEYLDFLINRYLKILDTRWLKEWHWKTVSQKLSEIGPNLEKVLFIDRRPWQKVICYLPNLKSVFYPEHCSDKFLLCLSKFCKYIETLDVKYSSRVSDNGLKHLCSTDDDKNPLSFHAPVKELSLEYTKVGVEGIAYVLKNMPCLEIIRNSALPNALYFMHKNDINALNKVKPYNLIHLNLFLSSYFYTSTDILKVCVFLCPHLKSLSCPDVKKEQLNLCYQLHELEKLFLESEEDIPLELNELLILSGKNLTSLHLSNFCISLSVLAQNCPHLKYLRIRNVNLQHAVHDSVPVFHNLETFILSYSLITNNVMFLFSSAPNLNQLCFLGCKLFSSEMKTHILKCCEQCKLSIIDFTSSDVELVLLKDILLTCSTLETLHLNRCSLFHDNKTELRTIASSLPNKPKVCFKDLSIYEDEYHKKLMS